MVAKKELVRNWITYLKNNQIIALQSDPKSGKLNYRRPVTTNDLFNFLSTSGFNNDDIKSALKSLKTVSTSTDQDINADNLPGEINQKNISTQTNNKPKSDDNSEIVPQSDLKTYYDNTKKIGTPSRLSYKSPDLAYDPNADAEDVEYKDIPRQPRQIGKQEPEKKKPHTKLKSGKPGEKPRFIYKGLREDIKDRPGNELSEKDVEQVFDILLNPAKKEPEKNNQDQTQSVQSNQKSEEQKIGELNKIKKLIHDSMSSAQRKLLWRLLNKNNQSENLSEADLHKNDIDELFLTARDFKDNPKGLGKLFKGLKKDSITFNDLQQAWKEEGFPTDSRDIQSILKMYGFSNKEIHDVFSSVFGQDTEGDPDIPRANPQIEKLVDYIQKNNLSNEVIRFLKLNYSDELGLSSKETTSDKVKNFGKSVLGGIFNRKATNEEIKNIFLDILLTERSDRNKMLQILEQANLGRNKKQSNGNLTQIEEQVTLNDVLKSNQYLKLLSRLKHHSSNKFNYTRIKNRIMKSWRAGIKSRKHFKSLLREIDLSLDDLIQ